MAAWPVALPFIHSQAALLRRGDGRTVVLGRPGKDPVRLRLRHLDTALAGGEVLGLRIARGHRQEARRALTHEIKEKILGLNARAALQYRYCRQEGRACQFVRSALPRSKRHDLRSPTASRQGELWRRLEGVNDPNSMSPVTDMGFIERAEVAADGSVDVGFRLPTCWCSPNFAFLMLDDVRSAMEALSWSPAYRITPA